MIILANHINEVWTSLIVTRTTIVPLAQNNQIHKCACWSRRDRLISLSRSPPNRQQSRLDGCPHTATTIRDNLLHFAAILSSMNSTCGFRYPRSHMRTHFGGKKKRNSFNTFRQEQKTYCILRYAA